MTFRAFPPLIAAVLVLGACARKEIGPPLFALDQCARVTLTDGASGAPVTGAEDLDIDDVTGRIFISAYDRRSAEQAAARRTRLIPQGGVYAIDRAALKRGETTFTLQPLLDPASIDGGLRPHGLSFDRDSGVLFFINRGYAADGAAWRRKIELVSFNPAIAGSLGAVPIGCSANDVTSYKGRILVTLDHGACGWRATLEDVVGSRSGQVIDDKGARVLAGLGFANGVVTAPGGDLVVAETRARAIHVVAIGGGGPEISETIKVRGAPDNLTLSGDGRIIAAIHPRLLAIGLQRRLGIGRSPSRVIDIDLATKQQRLLFDDPKAALISAATAAVYTDDLLVIGSVIDPGLVVCRSETAPQ